MARADVLAAQDLQACGIDPAQQFLARAQLQVLGQIRQNQPAFAARQQMCSKALDKTAQHAAAFVIDGLLQQGAGLARQPRWIADHQGGPAFREQVRLAQAHALRQTQPLKVVLRAGQCPVAQVGGHHLPHATVQQESGKHTRARADIPDGGISLLGCGRQGRLRHQIQVLAAHRGEHAVVRVNAELRHARHGQGHALLAPLMCAQGTQQFTQGNDHAVRTLVGGNLAPGFATGFAPVRCAAQGAVPAGIELDHHAGQDARTLRQCLAVQVEGVGKDRLGVFLAGAALARLGGSLTCGLVEAAAQGRQQLPGILEIAAPQHGLAFAGQAVGAVGGQAVISDDDAARCGHGAVRAPQGNLGGLVLLPLQQGPVLGRGQGLLLRE